MTKLPPDERVAAILAFDIDEDDPQFRFVDRLARENDWSIVYARRVVQEYRRFLALVAVSPDGVTPSEDVDQVWHLHLTYTESYWNRLCQQTLGFPLHHHPTRGGALEQEKFVAWYQRTLSEYQTLFGESPPTDIWPSAADRFSQVGTQQWVDRSHCWVVRKPTIGQWVVAICAATGLLAATGLVVLLRQLDQTGAEFLRMYAFVSILGTVAASLIRSTISDVDPQAVPQLDDPVEIAFLADGGSRATLTALAMLVHRRHLIVESGATTATLRRQVPLEHAARLEHALYEAVDPVEGNTIKDVVRAAGREVDRLEQSLREQDLVSPSPAERWWERGASSAVMATVMAIGLSRLQLGLARTESVGYLLLMICGVAVAWYTVCHRRHRTPLGEAAWRLAKERHAQSAQCPADVSDVSTVELALAVSMLGLPPLVGHYDAFVADYRSLSEPSTGGWSGGCGGGCSGCGGGCGGCGGCGG